MHVLEVEESPVDFIRRLRGLIGPAESFIYMYSTCMCNDFNHNYTYVHLCFIICVSEIS